MGGEAQVRGKAGKGLLLCKMDWMTGEFVTWQVKQSKDMKDHLYQAGLGSPSNSFSLKTNLMVVLEKKSQGISKVIRFYSGDQHLDKS